MRKEKQLLLDDIRDKMVTSKGFILTRYHKMNPNLASQFRGEIHKIGGDFEVMRKRILVKASVAAGLNLDLAILAGHIGVVFTTRDLLETAKVVWNFKKANEGILEVVGGQFEGQMCSAQDVELLSSISSKAEMQAQLLGLFDAIPSQLLAVMEALLTSKGS